jgi:hypothetical protein
MLDHILMYLRVQERTKTMLEVLCKNHKKQSKTCDNKEKHVHISVFNYQSHHACKSYTQHEIRD